MAATLNHTFTAAGSWNPTWNLSSMVYNVTVKKGLYISEIGAAMRSNFGAGDRAYLKRGSGQKRLKCNDTTNLGSGHTYFVLALPRRNHGAGGMDVDSYIQPSDSTSLYSGHFHAVMTTAGNKYNDCQYFAVGTQTEHTYCWRISGDATLHDSGAKFKIWVAAIAKRPNPSSVTCTKDATTTGKITAGWAGGTGAAAGNVHQGFIVIINTSKSSSNPVAQWSTNTNSTTSHVFTGIAGGSYYVGVLSKGTAGSDYYSDWVWSSLTACTWNVAPNAPTIEYPASATSTSGRKTTYNTKPYFKAKATDNNGDNVTFEYSIDGGNYVAVSGAVASGTSKSWLCSTTLSVANHYVTIRAKDSNNATGGTTTAYFKVANKPTVSAGSAIDDSHMAALKTAVDNLNAYYGLSYTVNTISQDALARNATSGSVYGWNTYIGGLNNTPHISGLDYPGAGNTIDDYYYNTTIGNKLTSG